MAASFFLSSSRLATSTTVPTEGCDLESGIDRLLMEAIALITACVYSINVVEATTERDGADISVSQFGGLDVDFRFLPQGIFSRQLRKCPDDILIEYNEVIIYILQHRLCFDE